MLKQSINVEIKNSENRCKKFFRVCLKVSLGAIVGTTSAVLMPAAQWLLNIRDKVYEQKPIDRLRWPAVLDIGASAVVAYGAVVRFGNPAIWCICLVEGCLSVYGFFRGIQISCKSSLINVPKKLWNDDHDIQQGDSQQDNIQPDNLPQTRALQATRVQSIINTSPQASYSISIKPELSHTSNTTKCTSYDCLKRSCNLVGGSILGVGAALLMPAVQSVHYILNAKRRWPPLINGGVLTYYALYVGSIYIGPEFSLLLLKRMAQVLGAYGVVRGGQIGYQETPAKVFTLMWQGGICSSPQIKEIVTEKIKEAHQESLGIDESKLSTLSTIESSPL